MAQLEITAGDTIPVPIVIGTNMTGCDVEVRIGSATPVSKPVTFTDLATGAGTFDCPGELPAGRYSAVVSITYPDATHICSKPFTLIVNRELP